jgi:hypothetical protein
MNEQEFWAALAPLPKPVYIYRLYYNDNGLPLFYSQEDLPGKYIEIDQATFARSPSNVCVVDEKLTYIKTSIALRLHPSETGTPCHPTNVSIVVDPAEPHTRWALK